MWGAVNSILSMLVSKEFPNYIVYNCGNIVLAIIMGKTSTKGDGANRENSSTI